MHRIILISTIHKNVGVCNADELFKIINNIKPEIIFLEALNSTYSNYDSFLFTKFNIYHKKLELNAIQKYSHIQTFEYQPVLDVELSEHFNNKAKIVTQSSTYLKKLEEYMSLVKKDGFKFLNSEKSIFLQENLRELEDKIVNDNELLQNVKDNINQYEDSMINNIYKFCILNTFKTAIFMCGIGHRKSIINKIKQFELNTNIKLNWEFYS